ncbi:UNKNOWN [Stylonychia lemnae]|uniref:Uncharacterized protein n=1 Tax=Stylonychia lemnae TaxID=5949 RepID=A0A078ATG5_STYLE|nr:UNKNOWN [Stylonychia lemnae]|eukprot:CDW85519.1 UNKNOWN [Stylonychia lemnae]
MLAPIPIKPQSRYSQGSYSGISTGLSSPSNRLRHSQEHQQTFQNQFDFDNRSLDVINNMHSSKIDFEDLVHKGLNQKSERIEDYEWQQMTFGNLRDVRRSCEDFNYEQFELVEDREVRMRCSVDLINDDIQYSASDTQRNLKSILSAEEELRSIFSRSKVPSFDQESVTGQDNLTFSAPRLVRFQSHSVKSDICVPKPRLGTSVNSPTDLNLKLTNSYDTNNQKQNQFFSSGYGAYQQFDNHSNKINTSYIAPLIDNNYFEIERPSNPQSRDKKFNRIGSCYTDTKTDGQKYIDDRIMNTFSQQCEIQQYGSSTTSKDHLLILQEDAQVHNQLNLENYILIDDIFEFSSDSQTVSSSSDSTVSQNQHCLYQTELKSQSNQNQHIASSYTNNNYICQDLCIQFNDSLAIREEDTLKIKPIQADFLVSSEIPKLKGEQLNHQDYYQFEKHTNESFKDDLFGTIHSRHQLKVASSSKQELQDKQSTIQKGYVSDEHSL